MQFVLLIRITNTEWQEITAMFIEQTLKKLYKQIISDLTPSKIPRIITDIKIIVITISTH